MKKKTILKNFRMDVFWNWKNRDWRFGRNFRPQNGRQNLEGQKLYRKGFIYVATILKSQKATQTTIAIIEQFTKIRRIISQLFQNWQKWKDESEQNLWCRKVVKIISDILGEEMKTT